MPAKEESVEPAGAILLASADGGVALLSQGWRWRYRTGQNEKKKNSPHSCNLMERASTAALMRHSTLTVPGLRPMTAVVQDA